jgi:Flp pilus assembly secretin CpaC
MALVLRRGSRRLRAFIVAYGIAAAVSGTADAADIRVVLDQAKLVKMPDRVATVVIGNPLIADAALQSGGMMVITGKGFGMTNIITLDRAGAVLMEQSVEVVGPRVDVVTVFRGIERESYSCAPICERRITLGDSPTYFDTTIGQVGSRNGQAQGAVPAPR